MLLLTPKELVRFQAKITVAGPDECWNWTACTTGAKALGWYGRFCLRNKRYYAHRGFPLEYLTDDLAILHECDNPLCCNPAHLTLGTQLDNVKDMIRKARHRNGRCGRRKQTPVEIPT